MLYSSSALDSSSLYDMVAVKQADRQASRILKTRSSKQKTFGMPVF